MAGRAIRLFSTAVSAPPGAAAAAGSAVAKVAGSASTAVTLPSWAKVPSVDQARARGLSTTPMWARYNVESSASLDIVEARKLPVLSSVEADVKGRKVIIYKATQNAMTSAKGASKGWRIRFQHADKWTNPLMGWISSADTLAPVQMHCRFETPEQAILFCERNGMAYEVNQTATTLDTPGRVDNQYAYNILPRDVMARMKALGPRRSRVIFDNPDGRTAQFVNYRRTQYGAEHWRPADYQTEAAWTGPAWPAPKPVAGSH